VDGGALMHLLTTLCICSLLATSVVAQQASSSTYILTSLEFASGDEADSSLFKVRPSFGTGVVPDIYMQSATYTLTAGFPASLDAASVGSPWAASARPFFVPQFGNPTVTIHGVDMDLGAAPVATIGGVSAPVFGRSLDRALVQLPNQPVPGYQPVEFTTTAGATRIEQGVGVLPMLSQPEPLTPTTPIRIRYHGTQNDLVVLALGAGIASSPFQLTGYGYSLQLDPGLILSSQFVFIGSPEGTFEINGPPLPVTGLLHMQCLVFTSTPGYAPGSWTNVIDL
jgi:hypothetical protein